MSNLTKVSQNIFGSNAGVDQISVFGSLFAGAEQFTTDPATVQSLSNFLTGWFEGVIGGNAPTIQDMNGLHFLMTYQLAYLMQKGVAEWDAVTTYYIGGIVNSGGVLYKSLTNNNINNAVTDETNWQVFASSKKVTTAVDYISSAGDFVLATAACVVTLPTAVGVVGQTVKIINTSNTAVDVQIATTSSQTVGGRASLDIVLRRKNTNLTVISDGTNWQILSKYEHEVKSATASGTITGASGSYQAGSASLALGIGEWEVEAWFGAGALVGSTNVSVTDLSGFYASDGANTVSVPTLLSAAVVDGGYQIGNGIGLTNLQASQSLVGAPFTTRIIVTSGSQTVYAVQTIGYSALGAGSQWYTQLRARRVY